MYTIQFNSVFFYKPILLYISLCLFVSCTEKINNTTVSLSHEDSVYVSTLKGKAINSELDTAINLLNEIKNFAKDKKDEQLLFNTYCTTAEFYSNRTDNFTEAKKQLDSAKLLNIANTEKNKSVLNLKYGFIYKGTDSAQYYLSNAIHTIDSLDPPDRKQACTALSLFFLTNQNYINANKYALKFLELNKKYPSPSSTTDELVTYNNLYLIHLGLYDTIKAEDYLLKAKSIEDTISRKNIYVEQSLGHYYLRHQKYDSAYMYYGQFDSIISLKFAPEYRFYPLTYYAKIELARKNYSTSKKLLDKAAKYSGAHDIGDPYIQNEYFKVLYQVSKHSGNHSKALYSLEQAQKYASESASKGSGEHLVFLQNQLKESENATRLAEKNFKINQQRFYNLLLIFGIVILFISAASIVIYFINKRKLQSQKILQLQQKAELEKSALIIETESKERRRIAQELHDEIGSTITTINMSINSLSPESKVPEKTLAILSRSSMNMNRQVSEIVWSLNEGNDTVQNLISFILKHATQFLDDNGFSLQYKIPEVDPYQALDGYKRRYIFQTVKEILNNAVKYSKGNAIKLIIQLKNNNLKIVVSDNGEGFNPETIVKGNGLNNIQDNIIHAGGNIQIDTSQGTTYNITVPLN